MFWMAITSLALAGDAKLGVLEMPVTPHPGVTEYLGLAPFEGADGDNWRSDTDRFACLGVGDLVEVRVDTADYPSQLPNRVSCLRGEARVSVRIKIDDRRLQPAIVGDGTLVMPRAKRNGALFRGPLPEGSDVVMGVAHASQLEMKCKVERGNNLYVAVEPEAKDGEGVCKLPTSNGGTFLLPVVLRTVKGARREHD